MAVNLRFQGNQQYCHDRAFNVSLNVAEVANTLLKKIAYSMWNYGNFSGLRQISFLFCLIRLHYFYDYLHVLNFMNTEMFIAMKCTCSKDGWEDNISCLPEWLSKILLVKGKCNYFCLWLVLQRSFLFLKSYFLYVITILKAYECWSFKKSFSRPG